MYFPHYIVPSFHRVRIKTGLRFLPGPSYFYFHQFLLIMPELPDVEVFTKSLDNILSGKSLSKIKVIRGEKLEDSEAALNMGLKGKRLRGVYRSGKEMRFEFSGGAILGLHLMLTGDVFLFNGKNPNKFTIVEMHFTGDTRLALTDRMRNAYIKLDPEEKGGVDALSKQLDFRYLKNALQRKAQIKKVLTDQNIIRGIGSSYADEILWKTRISPYSTAAAIPDTKVKELAGVIKSELRSAVKRIEKKYAGKINVEVKEFLKIHSREKEKSPTGFPILIDKQGMSSTFYTKEQVLY